MDHLTIDGGALAVRVEGEGEPVVLFHTGFVADGLAPLFGEPALMGYRLVAYHRRGYGGSEPAERDMSLVRQAHDALGVMRALGIERAHLVGHSFGADVALELALGTPQAAASLTLLEPLLPFVLDPGSAAVVAGAAAAAAGALARGEAETAVDGFLAAVWSAARAATADLAVAEDVTVAVMSRRRRDPPATRRTLVAEAVRRAVAIAPCAPFASLAPDEREPLALARLAGLDVDQIADIVGTDAATIRQRLLTALRALADRRARCALAEAARPAAPPRPPHAILSGDPGSAVHVPGPRSLDTPRRSGIASAGPLPNRSGVRPVQRRAHA